MKKKQLIHSFPASTPPTVLTIFGATGDLATKKLLPTLVHMDHHGLLPKSFRLVAVGRRDLSVKTFLSLVQKNTEEKLTLASVKKFARLVTYFRGDFENPTSFGPLAKVLEDKMLGKDTGHVCYNRLYYFATSPEYFENIARILKAQGLLIGCEEHMRTIRVLVEKPFGFDSKSAHSLNKILFTFFREEQIYRIDHFLGKETVQNLFTMRFANAFLEPLWHHKFVDHIELSVLNADSVDSRIVFYESVGAIRDVFQNHILQMLALVAMEPPHSMTTHDIRDAKAKVLKSIQGYTKSSILESVVRGQYAGYSEVAGRKSKTETFIALKMFVNNPRWRGVPFYIRTGKALAEKVTEISIHFKKNKSVLYIPSAVHGNVLSFRVQPDERVSMQFNNKVPGFGMQLHKANLNFNYSEFSVEIPGAYERLLLDFFQGDQRLFIRTDEIEAAWKFVDNIRALWQELPLHEYLAGSTGPVAADKLIAQDKREWWTK